MVSWLLDQHLPTKLVLSAPEQALTLRQPAPGLIIHADRGSQYTRLACRTRIVKAYALASCSWLGDPYDNAQAEAGARSKRNRCPTVARLPAWKKPGWR